MVDLATGATLNESMGSAIKHYSSLFFLPSFRKTLAALVVVCIGVLGLSTSVLLPSFEGLIYGISLGVSVFALTFLCDFLVTNVVLAKDAIFVMRRTAALSLFCWILWLAFVIPGTFVGLYAGLWFWIKLSFLGFSAVLTLRAVVFFSLSSVGSARGALAALLQPLLCIIPFLVYWAIVVQVNLLEVLPFLFLAPFLCVASANLLISPIDRLGRKAYGVPAMPLFRAFMLNWVSNLNAPIEQYFEKLGEDEDIEVSLLQFEAAKTKAAVIVPLVHPGPFKNIGSSLLPSLMKQGFEKAFGGEACVPLGILGHELDLASQAQNQKIISAVLTSAKQAVLSQGAKPFVKVTEGSVTVACQVFGDVALLSFSLAPKTTEDLPQELGIFVREEARKLGLKDAIVINAHNSITDVTEIDASLETLEAAASKCLSKAVSFTESSFQIGAVTVYPKEFTLKDGMGGGGITAIAGQVGDQKTAYIVIDGNNMISGLREKILSVLASLSFDESELFTTDTHSVNALVLGRRGYHPVGEAMNHELLLSYIKEAASTALARLEPCKSGALNLTVPKVRVIGKARIQAISTLVDKALQKAKQIVVPIFGLEGVLLILLLAVL
jgi:putative membrane protein